MYNDLKYDRDLSMNVDVMGSQTALADDVVGPSHFWLSFRRLANRDNRIKVSFSEAEVFQRAQCNSVNRFNPLFEFEHSNQPREYREMIWLQEIAPSNIDFFQN